MSAEFSERLRTLEGKAVLCDSPELDPKVYLIDAGRKRWIMTPEILERLGVLPESFEQLSSSELERVPSGETLDGALVGEIRDRVTRDHLRGRGIELGAGTRPQRLPPGVEAELFDKRSASELVTYFETAAAGAQPVRPLAEIPERFPAGADFLIAHHVLEHISNPIAALIEWFGWVRPGASLVVSVPDAAHSPDRGRLIPTLEHVLLDYLLDRGDDSFESREHVYSFLMGWCDDGAAVGIDKLELASRAHACAAAAQNDLHWHAFDRALFEGIVWAAGVLSGRGLELHAVAGPDSPSGCRPEGEIIGLLSVDDSAALRGHGSETVLPRVRETLGALEGRFGAALARLRGLDA